MSLDHDDALACRRMRRFLKRIWEAPTPDCWFFVSTSRPGSDSWRDHAIASEDINGELRAFLKRYSRWDYDLYFCPNAFSEPSRKKRHALRSKVGWCDIDDSDPDDYEPVPSIVWETSPGRFQGVWLWDKWQTPERAAAYSRHLAKKHGGDDCWSVTHPLRIPRSINHKPKYDEPVVRLIREDWRPIRKRPTLNERYRRSKVSIIKVNPHAHDRDLVFEKYRLKIHPKARALLRGKRVWERDRSAQIFLMVAELHNAGASPDEIACSGATRLSLTNTVKTLTV